MSDTTVQPAVRERKRRWRKMFAAGLGLLALAAAGYSLRPVGLGPSGAPPAPVGPPKLVVAKSVPLGAADLYSSVDAKFTVTNGGGSPLVIHEAKAGCRCQGVYVERPGSPPGEFRDLVIPPGGAETLGVRFAVGGTPGEPSGISVTLTSNDPAEPAVLVSITFVPTARLYFVPQALSFGTVLLGQSAAVSVEVFEDGQQGRIEWDQVACEPAEKFTVAFTPAPPGREALDVSGATRVGTLRATLRAPSTVGPLDDTLVLTARGKEVYRLPVSGRSVPAYEIAPAVVVLPRRSEGRPLYTARLTCRSHTGQAFTVQPKKLDASQFNIAVDSTEPAVIQFLTVAYLGPPVGRAMTQPIELVATAEGESAAVRFDVRLEPVRETTP